MKNNVKKIIYGDTIVTIKSKKRAGRTHYVVENSKYNNIFNNKITL